MKQGRVTQNYRSSQSEQEQMRKGIAAKKITARHPASNETFVIEVIALPNPGKVPRGAVRATHRYQTSDGRDVMRLAEGYYWIPHLNLEVVAGGGKQARRRS